MGDQGRNNFSLLTSIPTRASSSGLVNGVRPKSSKRGRDLETLPENALESTTAMANDPPQKKAAVHVTEHNSGPGVPSQDAHPPAPFSKPPLPRKHTDHSLHLETYFKGPRDMYRHSKWPYFLRLSGSVMPKMLLPIFVVSAWATLITCISKFIYDLGIDSVLLTVLGFVVGLALSFRSTTAYERYIEGRKYWAQLLLETRNLSRFIWIHVPERADAAGGKADLLAKLTAMNLITALAISLKHRLRFEPATDYPDLAPLLRHLDTATAPSRPPPESSWHAAGAYLGLSFLTPNPRGQLKALPSRPPNTPLELLHHLAAYIDGLVRTGQLPSTAYQSYALNLLGTLGAILAGADRITNTPLPLAYSIAISQITWVYVLALPFQLYGPLGWVAIPGTIAAAYIILGLAAIGREIENPFGDDVNDLPLDAYCEEIRADVEVLVSRPAPGPEDFATRSANRVLFPSGEGYDVWAARSVEEIRGALRGRGMRMGQVEEEEEAMKMKMEV